MTVDPILHASVIEVAERSPAGSRSAGVAERPGLKDTAAGVPKVVRVTQAKGVEFGRGGDLRMRAEDQSAEAILGIHHVEERRPRVRPRRR